PVDLGGEDDALAAPAALRQPASDDLLGDALAGAPAVDVGGIEEVDAELEGAVHDGEALGLSGEGTEVHGAETEAAHLEARPRETRVLHSRLIAWPPRGGRGPSSLRAARPRWRPAEVHPEGGGAR